VATGYRPSRIRIPAATATTFRIVALRGKESFSNGIRPVAISIDAPDISRKLSEEAGYTLTFLSDPAMDVIRRYDVAAQEMGARPAEFLVDASGVVRWRYLTDNVYARATSGQVIDAARTLPAPAVTETGTQFYARYLTAISKATSMDDVLAFWSVALAKQYTDAPVAQRVDVAGVKGIYGMVTNVTVVKETATTAGAVLSLEGTNAGKKVTGIVGLTRENAAWKIAGRENWTN